MIQAAVLIFVRVGAILLTAPLFSSGSIPVHVKVGLSFMLAVIVFPLVSVNEGFTLPLISLGVAMAGEVLIGVIIGFTARLLFAAVQLAGQLVGFQMGFGIVNVIDPQTSAQVSIIAQFENIITLLTFLALNAHHWFIMAIAKSFEVVPLLTFSFTNSLMEALVQLSCDMFVVAAKVAAPIIAILLFTSVALGLLARTVPQMNIFIVGFPLKLAIGLLAVGLTLPLLSTILRNLFRGLGEDMFVLMKLMV
jgi:flagellar biosynthetic protein FliR